MLQCTKISINTFILIYCLIQTGFQWCIRMDQQQETRGLGGHCCCTRCKEVRQSNLHNERLLKWHPLSSTYSFIYFNEDWIEWYFTVHLSLEHLSDSALHAPSAFIDSSITLFSEPYYWRDNRFSWINIVLPQKALKANIWKVIYNIFQIYRPPCKWFSHETLFCIHASYIHTDIFHIILLHCRIMPTARKQRWALEITN